MEIGNLWKETYRMKIVAELAKELPVTKLRKIRTSFVSQMKELEDSLEIVEGLIEQKESEGNDEDSEGN